MEKKSEQVEKWEENLKAAKAREATIAVTTDAEGNVAKVSEVESAPTGDTEARVGGQHRLGGHRPIHDEESPEYKQQLGKLHSKAIGDDDSGYVNPQTGESYKVDTSNRNVTVTPAVPSNASAEALEAKVHEDAIEGADAAAEAQADSEPTEEKQGFIDKILHPGSDSKKGKRK